VQVAFSRSFEFRLPLAWLFPTVVADGREALKSARKKVLLRASLWKNRLPADALPDEGWMDLPVEADDEWVPH
jgi:hypothetical protein